MNFKQASSYSMIFNFKTGGNCLILSNRTVKLLPDLSSRLACTVVSCSCRPQKKHACTSSGKTGIHNHSNELLTSTAALIFENAITAKLPKQYCLLKYKPSYIYSNYVSRISVNNPWSKMG